MSNQSNNHSMDTMTLRDYFAAKALASDWIGDYSITEGVEMAYKYADAMLTLRAAIDAARKEQP